MIVFLKETVSIYSFSILVNDMGTITRIRRLLWNLHIMNKCPLCGSELLTVGYLKDDGRQFYKCVNKTCEFGKHHT